MQYFRHLGSAKVKVVLFETDPSIKKHTAAILQMKLIRRYICHDRILLDVYVYELCTHSCV